MKEKMAMQTGGEHYFQPVLPLGCWKPQSRVKKSRGKKLLKRYQEKIDTTLAGVAIGLMFLTGVWMFLVQLATYAGN